MRKLKKGSILCFIGYIFGVSETIYFGLNIYPNSIYEVICDVISYILIILGCIIIINNLYAGCAIPSLEK